MPTSNPGSDPDMKPNSKQKSAGSGNRKNQNRRPNWPMQIMVGVAFLLLISAFFFSNNSRNIEELSVVEFEAKLAAEKIDTESVVLFSRNDGSEVIQGRYKSSEEEEKEDAKKVEQRFLVKYNSDIQAEKIASILATYKVAATAEQEPASFLQMFLIYFLPILLLFALFMFVISRQMKAAGKGAMSFGKSKAKMLQQEMKKITFADVAGVEEAKEEVTEIVDFLRDPQHFQKLGGSIPKGVLLVGSPGTGKTMLARAIAGEADVPFYSISGSDFVEMFVGVGASRVRDMFEQARGQAPCLVFIDEIDAVGRHRGHGLGGGHDEREQTLNQLLVEMDGFDAQEGVIIIAATNRPDVLDPALLRPGRFDRQVTVSLPDVKGREQILRVHSKKVKLSEQVDLAKVARGTPGYSGAELANVINESALLAARKGLNEITQAELDEARDKVRWGRERRSLALSDKEKRVTAVHEAGHAITLEALENTEPLLKVTIIPRGPSLGSTMWLPEEDKYNTRKNELLDSLVVAMGGRVAEEIVFGDVTSGASGDIRQATSIARKMVCEWGMSEHLGMVEYGESQGAVFLARDLGGQRNYSEDTAQKIDHEVRKLIEDAYERARQILQDHRQHLDAITEALLEYETLDGHHVKEIMEHGELKNPPVVAAAEPEPEPADAEENMVEDAPEEQEAQVPPTPPNTSEQPATNTGNL